MNNHNAKRSYLYLYLMIFFVFVGYEIFKAVEFDFENLDYFDEVCLIGIFNLLVRPFIKTFFVFGISVAVGKGLNFSFSCIQDFIEDNKKLLIISLIAGYIVFCLPMTDLLYEIGYYGIFEYVLADIFVYLLAAPLASCALVSSTVMPIGMIVRYMREREDI